ncbi:MAG: hypothetical protein CM15mP116_08810 [Synechococcus sp.]|nr:MAG: hypothetical protein CM15mP116_08810 [Synechococcus sp.]
MIESAPVFDTRVGNFAANIANRFVMPTLALLAYPYSLAQAISPKLLLF